MRATMRGDDEILGQSLQLIVLEKRIRGDHPLLVIGENRPMRRSNRCLLSSGSQLIGILICRVPLIFLRLARIIPW